MRVVLVVTINGSAESIIDGVTTNVETQPGEGGVGKLVVKGKDLSALMDIIELPGLPFPAMPPSARVLLVLAKYAAFGVIPHGHPEHRRHPAAAGAADPAAARHRLRLCQAVSRGEAGYVFYLEPGPAPGTSKAYWGPEIRVGEPQPALTTGMDAQTNVEQLSFNFDKETQDRCRSCSSRSR